MNRTGRIVIGVSAGIVAFFGVAAVALYFVVVRAYTSPVGYPDPPLVPPGATVLAEDSGWDNDDPMRTKVVVIEGSGVVDFYRRAYPGWQEVPVNFESLCLVNPGPDYTEVLDVWPYEGTRVPTGPDRYAVSTARFKGTGGAKRWCGRAWGWIPTDLVTADPLPG